MIGTNKRRAMLQTDHENFIVSSDGRSVWVNKEYCVAIFSPVSMQFLPEEYKHHVMTINNFKGNVPTKSDWNKFKEDVKREYKIEISDDHKPYYIK